MNHGEACELIDQVFTTVYEATDSWVDDNIGSHLAYLAWQIVRGDGGKVDWRVTDASPILALFERLFGKDDDVWKFITRPVMRHFIVTGRRAGCDLPTMTAHVVAATPAAAVRKFAVGWLYDGEAPASDYSINSVIEIDGAPKATHSDCSGYGTEY